MFMILILNIKHLLYSVEIRWKVVQKKLQKIAIVKLKITCDVNVAIYTTSKAMLSTIRKMNVVTYHTAITHKIWQLYIQM